MARPIYRAMRSHPKNRKKIRVVDGMLPPSSDRLGVDFASGEELTIAEKLLSIAEALPLPPVNRPGRPRKDAQPVSRQQQRYRARMVAKAHEALEKQKGGA